MQLESLKVFCDIASYRSFSKAAEVNGLTQPAVSRLVHELEKRLEVQLIDRSRRPLQLTHLGQIYYEGCKPLLEQYSALEASIVRARGSLSITVHVAAIYSVGLGDISRHVETFEQQHPHVKVHIEYVHPDRVYERVFAGIADFGLVSYPKRARDLSVLPWREEEMVVACAPAHALARRRTVPPALLGGEKFVAFDKELVIRREVDRFLRQYGVTVDVVLEFDNIENIKKGIQIGAGLALLPEPMLRQEVEAGTLRAIPLEGCRLVRPMGIIQRRQHRPCQATLDLIAMLRAAG